MKQYSASPVEMSRSLWRNRSLVWQMSKREVVGRYRGSMMGLLWSFFNPVVMLVIYTFVFSVVFQARWGAGGEESKAHFAVLLFVGMIVHGLFAECVNRAPNLILSNVNFVKRVVFPLEILPWVAIGSALFHSIISVAVLLAVQLIIDSHVPWTALLFPLILLPLLLATVGMSWLLAATGVFVRDIGQTVTIFTTVLLFLSPVFYPVSALPNAYQPFLYLNPLTFFIEEARHVLIWGELPNWVKLSGYYAVGLAIAWLGFWWFQRTRKGFADVL